MPRHIVERGAPGNTRQQSGLGQREARRRLVEVSLARRRETAKVWAKAGAVDVLLDDLVFAERPLDADGERHFAELAAQGSWVGPEGPRELHREGRAAGHDPGLREIRDGRADGREGIDAEVVVESPVLGGEQGVEDSRADAVEREPRGARAVLRAHLPQRPPARVRHPDRAHGRALAKLGRERRGSRQDDEEQHRCEQEQRAQEGEAAGAKHHGHRARA